MNISRPPDGFRIHFRYEKIEKAVAAESVRNEKFGRTWGDLLERLKMTAHIEGRPAPHIGNGCRLFVSDPDPEAGTPRILVGYLVLGETVSIRLVVLDSGDVARILSEPDRGQDVGRR